MTAVTANISVSLDGYVAGPNDSSENPLGDGGERLHEWIYDLESWREQHDLEGGEISRDDEIVADSIENAGAVVMGRRMFSNEDGPWGDEPFEGHWGEDPPFGVPVFVLTHHPREPLAMDGATTFTFVTDGIESAVARAKDAAGDRNVSIAGGASTIQQSLEAGLLDELEIHLVPVLLGDGVRLFDRLDTDRIELERTRVVDSPSVTHLKFRVGTAGTEDRRSMTHTETTDTSLTVRRTFDAPRERVFRAFTEPTELEAWYTPGDATTAVHVLEPESGGTFSLSFVDEGTRTDVEGTFVEVLENERIVHTWTYPDEDESRVTYEFRAVDDGTEVVLAHEGIGPYRDHSAGENVDEYVEGWSNALEHLDAFLREVERDTAMPTKPNDEVDSKTGETSTTTRRTVQSRDGTTIAYDRSGEGPTIILVAGALGVRSHPMATELAAALAPRFTVFNYDRRGRGESGDTPPYAPEREIDDLDALIDAAGGSAFVYGISSGAVLALEAANALPEKVEKLALYEPPFILDDSRPPVPETYVQQLEELVAADRRGDAVEFFLTEAVGIPDELVAQMRTAPPSEDDEDGEDEEMAPPEWAAMEAVAHTLAYDGTIVGETVSGKPLPADRWAAATAPTLVINGEESEAFMHDGARALVDVLPDARHRTLSGQDHDVAPEALAPALETFFAG